jgi:hypothetical protein
LPCAYTVVLDLTIDGLVCGGFPCGATLSPNRLVLDPSVKTVLAPVPNMEPFALSFPTLVTPGIVLFIRL